jgi:hypothetical protein
MSRDLARLSEKALAIQKRVSLLSPLNAADL